MRERTLRSLIDAPRWLFLVTLIYAPWAYGCTGVRAINLLSILTWLTVGTWLLGCLVRRVSPRVSPIALGAVVLLLCMGWGMAGNAHSRYIASGVQFTPIRPLVAFAPGGIDGAASLSAMAPITGILSVLLFVSEFSRRAEWRRRLWWTIGLTGSSVVFLGLFQRASGIPLMFPYADQARSMFFGPYSYHGNAGSFINLVVPAIAGLLLLSVRKAVDDFGRLIWVPSLLMALVAAGLCFSRMALVITALISLALWCWAMRHLPRTVVRWQIWLYPALAVLAIVGVTASIGWAPMWEKWRILGSQLNAENPRWQVSSVAWRMVGDSGAFGFGAGTFALAFPHYMKASGVMIPGIWRYAQQDYLETVIEWGWLGAAAWLVLCAGALICAVRAIRSGKLDLADRTLVFVSIVALAGVALHSLVDYPLQIASLQLYVATYLGMCWGSPRWIRDAVETEESKSRREEKRLQQER
jgi:hypothetical protein